MILYRITKQTYCLNDSTLIPTQYLAPPRCPDLKWQRAFSSRNESMNVTHDGFIGSISAARTGLKSSITNAWAITGLENRKTKRRAAVCVAQLMTWRFAQGHVITFIIRTSIKIILQKIEKLQRRLPFVLSRTSDGVKSRCHSFQQHGETQSAASSRTCGGNVTEEMSDDIFNSRETLRCKIKRKYFFVREGSCVTITVFR